MDHKKREDFFYARKYLKEFNLHRRKYESGLLDEPTRVSLVKWLGEKNIFADWVTHRVM